MHEYIYFNTTHINYPMNYAWPIELWTSSVSILSTLSISSKNGLACISLARRTAIYFPMFPIWPFSFPNIRYNMHACFNYGLHVEAASLFIPKMFALGSPGFTWALAASDCKISLYSVLPGATCIGNRGTHLLRGVSAEIGAAVLCYSDVSLYVQTHTVSSPTYPWVGPPEIRLGTEDSLSLVFNGLITFPDMQERLLAFYNPAFVRRKPRWICSGFA